MKGRAQPGLDLYLGLERERPRLQFVNHRQVGRLRSSRLRIDQVVELLGPILIEVLQDNVLLDGRVPISLGQQRPS